VSTTLWQKCVDCLKNDLPTQQFNTWIRPLQAKADHQALRIYAPNRFVLEWVREHFWEKICTVMAKVAPGNLPELSLEVGGPEHESAEGQLSLLEEPSRGADTESSEELLEQALAEASNAATDQEASEAGGEFPGGTNRLSQQAAKASRKLSFRGELNRNYTFNNFIQGKSNQIARAAAAQVASNPGGAYNPLFIYGGVGLGKTHLMHAIGNHLLQKNPSAKVIYLHSQTFVGSMVSALRLNAINEFKRYYHSADALLIDDIQFFANKERSQEEFFHTFNAIFEGGRQIIMTCDKYHSEINGLEERLKSRFGWGLSVAVEPPDLETRAAILINKALQDQIALPEESAMFMAQKLRSNVRELEGALKKCVAHARFLGEEISVPLIKDALKDLLAIQNKLVSVDNIQRTVAEYYKIKMADMISKRRNRSVARPRQMAMCLSKELTNHSLPEIGSYYGGRDHTTVLHACRTIKDLRKSDTDIEEDYQNLMRSLSS